MYQISLFFVKCIETFKADNEVCSRKGFYGLAGSFALLRKKSKFTRYLSPSSTEKFCWKKYINISIRTAVRNLGVNLCENILFIHALIGCDTTFSLYGLRKGLSLKAFRERERECILSRTG